MFSQVQFQHNSLPISKTDLPQFGVCRLISVIVDICDRDNVGGYLATIDIQKVFDSLDDKLIFAILKKSWFWEKFVSWVEALLNNK